MTEFVRVRLDNGAEVSVSKALAEMCGLKPLNKPAARNGVALPAKYPSPIKPKPSDAKAETTTQESEQ